MSLQDLFNGLNQLHSDGDLRGAINHIINSNIGNGNLWQPCVDVIDTKNNLYIYAEIPGTMEDSIDVEFFNNKLTISGEKLKKYTTVPYKKEIIYGKFKRCITLPLSVTTKDNVVVKFDSGILTICIDKKKEGENKFKIKVSK
jgi:HSP20 family molecular chaperone IbpA